MNDLETKLLMMQDSSCSLCHETLSVAAKVIVCSGMPELNQPFFVRKLQKLQKYIPDGGILRSRQTITMIALEFI